ETYPSPRAILSTLLLLHLRVTKQLGKDDNHCQNPPLLLASRASQGESIQFSPPASSLNLSKAHSPQRTSTKGGIRHPSLTSPLIFAIVHIMRSSQTSRPTK